MKGLKKKGDEILPMNAVDKYKLMRRSRLLQRMKEASSQQEATRLAVIIYKTYYRFNADGGPGSGNWGHEGRPGEVGGSAPDGSAFSKTSIDKLSRVRESFDKEDNDFKCEYLRMAGQIKNSELEELRNGLGNNNQVAIDRLNELSKEYFDSAEHSRQVKSLNVEMRETFSNMTPDEQSEFLEHSMDRKLDSHESWANQESYAQKVAIDFGMNETPQVVCKEDFDNYVVETGATVLYRGVKSTQEKSGVEMFNQMLYNTKETYYGNGIYGDGIYFSTDQSIAKSYSNEDNILTCALRPDAKICEFTIDDNNSDVYQYMKKSGIWNFSIAAICCGYDVIKASKSYTGESSDYYSILNRAALVAIDPMDNICDSAFF